MDGLNNNIMLFVLAGFFAQIVNGSLGMAYGVLSSALLLSLGLAPSAASASVHLSELFTQAASGYCHKRLGNVDPQLARRLILPGIIGGITGAYLLTKVPGHEIKPFISLYLLFIGLRIFLRAFNRESFRQRKSTPRSLGLVAGFLDAIGGGGWGSIVTSNLVAHGNNPRYAIGSTNFARFFVTLATAVVFVATLGLVHIQIIIGLSLGGIIAAPIAAPICKYLKPRPLIVAVSTLIIGLSIRNLWQLPIVTQIATSTQRLFF
jgi:uncharacterized membrane protein YfcA